MNKFTSTLIMIIVWFSLGIIADTPVYAFSEKTHKDVNTKAVTNSNLDSVLQDSYNFVNGSTETVDGYPVSYWISLGGELEDVNYYDRSINHFHDPTKPLDQAGFSGLLYGIFFVGESSILWAQDSENNLKSWPAARQYLYDALTATSETERAENFKNTFLSVGQVMHLIEDSSVPLHTRDVFHHDFNYESWVEQVRNKDRATFASYLQNPIYPSTFPDSNLPGHTDAPVLIAQLVDTERYTGSNPDVTVTEPIGLAEYSNANFVSYDTMFRKYQYPAWGSVEETDYDIAAELGVTGPVVRSYWKKIKDGDAGYRLATVDYLRKYITKYFPDNSNEMIKGYIDAVPPALDGGCYNDYAERLVPRALGYATTLLNYFFRGEIDAVETKEVKGENKEITGMTFKVKNKTSDDAIGWGKLQVSYRYKDPEGGYVYGTSGKADISYLSSGATSTETYAVDFNMPIPADAKETGYMLVFRGQLGAEADAVAAKAFKSKLFEVAPQYAGGGNYTFYFVNDGNYSYYKTKRGLFNVLKHGQTITSAAIYIRRVSNKGYHWFPDGSAVDITAKIYTNEMPAPKYISYVGSVGQLLYTSETVTVSASNLPEVSLSGPSLDGITEVKFNFPEGARLEGHENYILMFEASNPLYAATTNKIFINQYYNSKPGVNPYTGCENYTWYGGTMELWDIGNSSLAVTVWGQ